MLTNPYLPSPAAAAAWAEGFTKGFLAIASAKPSGNVGADDVESFNRDVEERAQCAVDGFELDASCVSATALDRRWQAL